jgi:hypothetical protein
MVTRTGSADTFRIELLLAGVPFERVSILLGHQSVRITERYYAAWTDARQHQAQADLRARLGAGSDRATRSKSYTAATLEIEAVH